MGCAQSTPAQALEVSKDPGGRGEDITFSSVAASPGGKDQVATKNPVRDSVQDISPSGKQHGKGIGIDSKASSSQQLHAPGSKSSDLPASASAGKLQGSSAISDSSGRVAETCSTAMTSKPASKDLGPHGGGASDQHPGTPTLGASVPGGAPGSASNRAGGSGNPGSNRSSFANEALTGPRSVAEARRSGHRSSLEEAQPILHPAVLEARSSKQARLSSIQAADVMGIGGDKAPAPTRAMPASYDPLPGYQPPPAAAAAYPLLGALPPDTPVPLDVLQRLWKCASGEEALQVAHALSNASVLRLAVLDDGSRWALPAPQHLAHAAAAWPGVTEAAHRLLLDGYTRKDSMPLEALRDDGYIIQALSYHLLGAHRLEALRQLLMNPGWLEAKLHAYGIGAVVRDFRRYLQDAEGEESMDVKLLLQAFQLSLGTAMEHPTARMMREQMLARLMAVSQTGRLRDWYDDQAAKCAAEGMLAVGSRLLHLMPRTPSLTQAGGVQRMTLRGHTAAINRVAIAPNCCDVVAISEDGSAQVWDMNIGDCVMQLARDSPLTAVGITPDSLCAVVGAADGTAAVWDLAAGRISRTLVGHTARINALAIDKQGIRCVTASDDHTGRVWNLADGSCEAVLSGHGTDGALVGVVLDVCICADGTLAVTASDDFSARVWDLDEDGEPMHTLEGHNGWVTSCAFIGTSHRVVTASHDCTARVWDALKGRCLAVLEGHSGRLNRVAVDAGGSWIVTSSDDFTARVWNADTYQLLQTLEGHSGAVVDAAITRDCTKAVTVSGDGSGAVWDLASGKRDATLEGHTGEVNNVVLTQRGRFAVTAGSDATARVWDLAAAPLAAPPCHSGKVAGLRPLPDGQLLVSAGEDGQVFLWDPIEGACLKRKEGHRAGVRFMQVSQDGNMVVTGSGDRQICCWNWAEYSAVASTAGKRRSIDRRDVMLGTMTTADNSSRGGNTDGRHSLEEEAALMSALGMGGGAVAGGKRSSLDPRGGGPSRTGSMDSRPRHMSPLGGGAAPHVPATSPGLASLAGVAARPPASPVGTLGSMRSSRSVADLIAAVQAEPLQNSIPAQQGSRVKHMAFDAACRTAAVLLFDSTVSLWDVATGKCTAQLIKRAERDASRTHSGGVNAVYLTRDGLTAVTISKDNTARVWDVPTATTRFVVEGHTDGLVCADLSADEALLATGAYDKTVRVTRLQGGLAVAVLDHPHPPTSLSFSPDGRRLAVALEDFTLVVWDLVARCCMPSLEAHKAALTTVTWSPDSRFLLTASQDCTVHLWRAEDGRHHAFFMADVAITAACFTGHSSNDIIAVGDAQGAVHFLDFGEEIQG